MSLWVEAIKQFKGKEIFLERKNIGQQMSLRCDQRTVILLDVDQRDVAGFQRCYTDDVGPVALPDPCRCFDRDLDADVDHDDWEEFQPCSSGPDVPADPDCD